MLHEDMTIYLCQSHLHDDAVRRWFEARVMLRALVQT